MQIGKGKGRTTIHSERAHLSLPPSAIVLKVKEFRLSSNTGNRERFTFKPYSGRVPPIAPGEAWNLDGFQRRPCRPCQSIHESVALPPIVRFVNPVEGNFLPELMRGKQCLEENAAVAIRGDVLARVIVSLRSGAWVDAGDVPRTKSCGGMTLDGP